MSVVTAIKSSFTLKVAITLAVVIFVLTSAAAFFIVSRETATMEELTLSKAKMAATVGAQVYGNILERGAEMQYYSLPVLFERNNYQEIKGWDWKGNPRYHTKYDWYTDQNVVLFQETFMKFEDFAYASASDSAGFCPTHNVKFQAPMTGTPSDIANNRMKRIFKDEVSMKAVSNTLPILVQRYKAKDSDIETWDVSAPIFVKGKHWGGFRVGVDTRGIAARKAALVWTLVGFFSIFLVVSVGAIGYMVKNAMRPLVALSEKADEISIGEGLENTIIPGSTDEIGQMAKSLDRLRASLKAAMARIGE